MWFVGKSSHLLNSDWSVRKSSCQSVVTIGELLSECQHDRLTSKAADQVSHGFEWLLFDGHIALFCLSEGTSKISSVDNLTKVPWIHYGGLTTSHTRLAQMVADTIFDRRELGLSLRLPFQHGLKSRTHIGYPVVNHVVMTMCADHAE